jgi:hypothetical protein
MYRPGNRCAAAQDASAAAAIERRLRMSWRTIKKYLDAPTQGPTQRQGESRLDPCEADTLRSCSPRGSPSVR